jgi:hypothetical protein
MTMKICNLLFACILVLITGTTYAQDNLGAFQEGVSLRAYGGLNMFGSADVSISNSFSRFDIVYDHLIVKESENNPALGLSLVGNITPFNKGLNDAEYINYNVMQTGTLGFNPSLFIISKPVEDLKVFFSASAGIQYYPLISNDSIDWGKLDGFEQRSLGLGLGFEYNNLFRTSIQTFRRWHDFSSRSEAYYQANISEDTNFSNLHYNFTLTPFGTFPYNKEGKNPSKGIFYLFLNWYGGPSSDPRTKFYNIGLGFTATIPKKMKP